MIIISSSHHNHIIITSSSYHHLMILITCSLLRSPWTVTISSSPIQTHQNQTRWVSLKGFYQTPINWKKDYSDWFEPDKNEPHTKWSCFSQACKLQRTLPYSWLLSKSCPSLLLHPRYSITKLFLFKVHLLNSEGEVKFTSRHKEDVLR